MRATTLVERRIAPAGGRAVACARSVSATTAFRLRGEAVTTIKTIKTT